MKKYTAPCAELVVTQLCDIITASVTLEKYGYKSDGVGDSADWI